MKTIIIEDEKPSARLLQRKVENLGCKVEIMLHSVEEAIEWFGINEHPEIIFLDIQLSDGLSFEIFESIKIDSAVIFTTAYDEYALRAFKLNSIDYLLKPIDNEELEVALNKFRDRNTNSKTGLDFETIKKMFTGTTDEYKKRFSVRVGQQIKVVTCDEIECIYSENKGTYIHTTENRDYLIDSSIEQIEKQLNPKDFFRINRKYIIPIKSIKEIQVYTNSRLKLILQNFKDDDIIVAREKVTYFKQWIG
jgi:two-component system, LytTR family, response regulator LytT